MVQDNGFKVARFENEFRLTAELLLPCKVDEIFPFFADAKNLALLTPSFLNFKIASTTAIEIKVGAVIDYHLRIRGLPLHWKSLISHWDPPCEFVDEQLRGPYRYWIHRHSFEDRGAETLVRDFVRYQVFGGSLVHDLIVKPDLIKIFAFRQEKLVERFCDSGEETLRRLS